MPRPLALAKRAGLRAKFCLFRLKRKRKKWEVRNSFKKLKNYLLNLTIAQRAMLVCFAMSGVVSVSLAILFWLAALSLLIYAGLVIFEHLIKRIIRLLGKAKIGLILGAFLRKLKAIRVAHFACARRLASLLIFFLRLLFKMATVAWWLKQIKKRCIPLNEYLCRKIEEYEPKVLLFFAAIGRGFRRAGKLFLISKNRWRYIYKPQLKEALRELRVAKKDAIRFDWRGRMPGLFLICFFFARLFKVSHDWWFWRFFLEFELAAIALRDFRAWAYYFAGSFACFFVKALKAPRPPAYVFFSRGGQAFGLATSRPSNANSYKKLLKGNYIWDAPEPINLSLSFSPSRWFNQASQRCYYAWGLFIKPKLRLKLFLTLHLLQWVWSRKRIRRWWVWFRLWLRRLKKRVAKVKREKLSKYEEAIVFGGILDEWAETVAFNMLVRDVGEAKAIVLKEEKEKERKKGAKARSLRVKLEKEYPALCKKIKERARWYAFKIIKASIRAFDLKRRFGLVNKKLKKLLLNAKSLGMMVDWWALVRRKALAWFLLTLPELGLLGKGKAKTFIERKEELNCAGRAINIVRRKMPKVFTGERIGVTRAEWVAGLLRLSNFLAKKKVSLALVVIDTLWKRKSVKLLECRNNLIRADLKAYDD